VADRRPRRLRHGLPLRRLRRRRGLPLAHRARVPLGAHAGVPHGDGLGEPPRGVPRPAARPAHLAHRPGRRAPGDHRERRRLRRHHRPRRRRAGPGPDRLPARAPGRGAPGRRAGRGRARLRTVAAWTTSSPPSPGSRSGCR
jgi:hypothetical protein